MATSEAPFPTIEGCVAPRSARLGRLERSLNGRFTMSAAASTASAPG